MELEGIIMEVGIIIRQAEEMVGIMEEASKDEEMDKINNNSSNSQDKITPKMTNRIWRNLRRNLWMSNVT